jgi:hypothetical protein
MILKSAIVHRLDHQATVFGVALIHHEHLHCAIRGREAHGHEALGQMGRPVPGRDNDGYRVGHRAGLL